MAPTKTTARGCPLSELPTAQTSIAIADAQLRAAKLLLHDAVADLCAGATAGVPTTVEQRARVRAAMTFAGQTSRTVVNSMYELGSSSSLYVTNRLERIFRDGNAAAQHGLLNALTWEPVGRVLLGQDPEQFVF